MYFEKGARIPTDGKGQPSCKISCADRKTLIKLYNGFVKMIISDLLCHKQNGDLKSEEFKSDFKGQKDDNETRKE